MSANEHYVPAFYGGIIRGVQMNITNTSGTDVTAKSRNGIYYVYQGHKFQLLSLGSETIAAYSDKVVSVVLKDLVIPSTDVKLMVDTAGLVGCEVTAMVLWGVE